VSELLDIWQEFYEFIARDPESPKSRPVDGLLGPDLDDPTVRSVYKGEPIKGYEEFGVTVTCTPGAMPDPLTWGMTVRVYHPVGERPLDAQMRVVEAAELLDELLSARYEMAAWVFDLQPALGAWMGEATYGIGREIPAIPQ